MNMLIAYSEHACFHSWFEGQEAKQMEGDIVRESKLQPHVHNLAATLNV